MTRSKKYNSSDVWLLLAIIYASGEKSATLDEIIAAGDWINHAIFNEDELESGLARLTAGGFIKEKNNAFSATQKVKRAYSKTTGSRRIINEELKDIGDLIGAASPVSKQPNINNLKYANFSHELFRAAVDKYLKF